MTDSQTCWVCGKAFTDDDYKLASSAGLRHDDRDLCIDALQEQLAEFCRLLREVLRGRRRFMRDSLGKELYEAVEKAGGVE